MDSADIPAGSPGDVASKVSRSVRRSLRQGICRFLNMGGVIFGALSNTGIYRKIKQGLRWLHGNLCLLRCKLERPCGGGVKGLHGSVVERPARSTGCETERTLKPGTTGWWWRVLLDAPISRQKCAADILVRRTQFYLYCRPEEHPPNLLVRLTFYLT